MSAINFPNRKTVLSDRAKALAADPQLLKVDWKAVKQIIANAIPLAKLEANKTKSITVLLYFNDQGLLKEVSFGVDPKSTIDGKDLEAIENSLVEKVKGTIKNDAYKGTNVISLGDAYPMSVLLKMRTQ